MFPDVGKILQGLLYIAYICVPLAVWKVIDIIIWIFNNVEINIKWIE